ncbi:MAG: glycerate kinase type-2 family protein [Hyphomicrobiaceae bacterium]
MPDPRKILRELMDAAIAAAHPAKTLGVHLPDISAYSRVFVTGAGKAASAMVQALEAHYASTGAVDRLSGEVATRHGYQLPSSGIKISQAGHPVPDDASVAASHAALAIADAAREDDLVIALLSGGASAIWTGLAPGITLERYQDLTRDLLRSGATISEINTVRKHLSCISGGRLAARVAPAQLMTFAISDVSGDDPSMIGSGPTVPDPTTLDDAANLLRKYDVAPAAPIAAALADPANETPKPGDPAFANSSYRLIAAPKMSLDAAAKTAEAHGYTPVVLGDAIEGEARDVALTHAKQAMTHAREGKKIAMMSGGELTVTIAGNGRGGPNQEYALALAIALDGAPNIHVLAADTDGTDGGDGSADDPAGAIVTPDTLARADSLGLDASAALAQNDSAGFFRALNDLIVTGATQTNVNDFRVILIDPTDEGQLSS